jgi:hypothetical protein
MNSVEVGFIVSPLTGSAERLSQDNWDEGHVNCGFGIA